MKQFSFGCTTNMSVVMPCWLKNVCGFVVVWFVYGTVSLQSNCVTAQQIKVLQTTATLSEARYYLAATSSGDLVFFGGGIPFPLTSDQVDIYNVTNESWTTATLSVPRYHLAATFSGNLVFFAGGWNGTTYFNQVDVYNISDGNWSNATLSQPRYYLAATSVGNLVLFGGGQNGTISCTSGISGGCSGLSNIVDIYNVTNSTWTSATLSQPRCYLAATSVANRYTLFAGGYNGLEPSNIVDIFDSLNGTWNTAILSEPREYLAATSLGNLAFFGGGDFYCCPTQTSNVIDIFNATAQTWSTATLSQNRTYLAATSIGDIVAFGGGTSESIANFSAVVDMYNATSNIWFTVTLSQPRSWLAATSSTNQIFFGGGDNSDDASNTVDIFCMNARDCPLPPPAPILVTSPNFATSSQFSTSAPFVLTNTTVSLSPQQYTLSSLNFGTSSNVQNTNNVPLLLSGIMSAVAVLIVATSILLIVLLRKKRKNSKSKRNTEVLLTEGQKRGTISLESDRNTITDNETDTSTLTTYHSGTETMKGFLLSLISIAELETGNEIGEGTYGRVCVGKWKKYRVALKFCQNKGQMDEFLREANLMISLPPHPNVVRMYGISIDGTQPIIVMEYCAGGSLDKVLYDRRQQISEEQKNSLGV